MADTEIHPFRIEIPQADLDDLATGWPGPAGPTNSPWHQGLQTGPVPPGWQYGVPVGYVRDLVEHWQHEFDWRAREARLNGYPQFLTEIDGQNDPLRPRAARPSRTPRR